MPTDLWDNMVECATVKREPNEFEKVGFVHLGALLVRMFSEAGPSLRDLKRWFLDLMQSMIDKDDPRTSLQIMDALTEAVDGRTKSMEADDGRMFRYLGCSGLIFLHHVTQQSPLIAEALGKLFRKTWTPPDQVSEMVEKARMDGESHDDALLRLMRCMPREKVEA